MSQAEIKKWLKSHPDRKYTAEQLSRLLKITLIVVHQNLKRLRDSLDSGRDTDIKYDIYYYQNRAVKRYWYE